MTEPTAMSGLAFDILDPRKAIAVSSCHSTLPMEDIVGNKVFSRLDGLLNDAEILLSASPKAAAKLFHDTSDWMQLLCTYTGCGMLIGLCEVRLSSIRAEFLAKHPALLGLTLDDDDSSEYSESDFQ